jgi:hypothetical protein
MNQTGGHHTLQPALPHFGPDPVWSLPISVPGTDMGKHFGPTVDPLWSRWTDLGAHIGTYI